MRRIILASLLVGFALGGAASAAPPTVKLQGSLADLSGQEATPADGTFGLTVRVYDAMTGGSELASFGPSSVEVRGGLYEIELPLTPDVFDGSVRYVEVEIDGEVLTPRIRIVSTPYALRASVAETAESVADGSVDGDALAPGAVSLVSLGIVCGTGETLVYNGSAWTCAALPGQATPVCPLGSELICYEGPDETRDVGNCGPGTSACLADQSGWGPCLGQVLPEADEDCESVGDEDCDGIEDLDDPDCLGTLTPSDRIDLVKNTPEDVDIVGATVTYVRPAIGNDPAGFYIQADPLGPALLIAVDPASLSPIPQAGDVVDFTPTSEGEVGGQRRVTALTNFVRTGTGSFIADQDVTGTTDLVTNRVDYDAELVSLDLIIDGSFSSSGAGFEQAVIDTSGIQNSNDLRLRLPSSLRQSLGLLSDCSLTLTRVPFNIFNNFAQPSAYVAGDISNVTCPPPQLQNGDACTQSNQCISGFCVDGVCCNSSCSGTCFSCNLSSPGTCAPVPSGQDPDNECSASGGICGQTGACSGGGTCAVTPAGTICGPEICSDPNTLSIQQCNGSGTCVPSPIQTCDCVGNECQGDPL